MLSGEKRKRIIFDDNFGEEWIEGIGSTFGLPFVAYLQYSVDLDHELNCFFEKGELKYQNLNYDLCWYTTVGIKEKQTECNWSIIPNPFENTCIIKPDHAIRSNYDALILNLQGMQIEAYQNTSGEIIIGENLKKGFYIFQIIEKGILRQTGKLIKK